MVAMVAFHRLLADENALASASFLTCSSQRSSVAWERRCGLSRKAHGRVWRGDRPTAPELLDAVRGIMLRCNFSCCARGAGSVRPDVIDGRARRAAPATKTANQQAGRDLHQQS